MLKNVKGVVNSKFISAYDTKYCEILLVLIATIQTLVL